MDEVQITNRGTGGPTGAELMRALAVQSGGAWERMGRTYVLVRSPEELAFQYLPAAEKNHRMGLACGAVFRSLSAEQIKTLQSGMSIPFAALTPAQQAHFRTAALYHHALMPFYQLGDATGSLTPFPKGAAITVGPEQTHIMEWDWARSR